MDKNQISYNKLDIPVDEELVSRAKLNPNTWVYDIDWDYKPDQRVPPEAIRGGWEVDSQGNLTGLFARNGRYRPIEHCERLLPRYMHAAAMRYPGRWIVEIDPRGEALFPAIPDELIRGWWYVDNDGKITDLFRENSLWEPPE
jgi:hypothetical protein